MVQVPKIVSGASELNANSEHPAARLCNVYHPAFALFLRQTVHQQDGLPRHYRRGNRDIRAKRIHANRAGVPAERMIVGRASVHLYRNSQRQPLTAAVRGPRVLLGA